MCLRRHRETAKLQQQLRFSQRFECKQCNIRYEEPEPRLFSFNNPFGACPRCQGFGNTIDFDLNLVIPNKTLTLAEGAIEPWTKPKYKPLATEMRRYARAAGVPLDVPWQDLDRRSAELHRQRRGQVLGRTRIFRAPGAQEVQAARARLPQPVPWLFDLLRLRWLASASRGSAGQDQRQGHLPGFGDDRGRGDALLLATRAVAAGGDIAGKLLEEINDRLRYLNDVGLEYLTLDRLASTLSGGEAQRIQLATSLGSRLVGTLYVLDEPSIGLHSRDTERLIKILQDLRDLGNTILVVEHDAEIMRSADRIIDLGPGAGENGGKLIASGTYDEILHDPASLTGRYLSGELRIQLPPARRTGTGRKIKLIGARAHNLKKVSVDIPLGMLVCITGVSGSGKSTLVHDVLYNALAAEKQQVTGGPAAEVERVEGAEWIDEVVLVDQSPIGRTPRSNPVTYIKAFDAIRELFAALPESEKRGYAAGHFSFNIPGGRCEVCQGDGTVTVEMQFLADVELICEECKGTRYKPEILEIRYHGKNIHDVLDMTVKEALHFFSGVPKIVEKMRVLEEVGLGYLRLGQSATTLSGGEAQRMKLAAHLQPRLRDIGKPRSEQNKRQPRMLYIFDEPTTGLHFDDVSKLLSAFRRLIEAGGSIVVIEHNLDVIKTADWVIDLGPEGGSRGGRGRGRRTAGGDRRMLRIPTQVSGWRTFCRLPSHSDGD